MKAAHPALDLPYATWKSGCQHASVAKDEFILSYVRERVFDFISALF